MNIFSFKKSDKEQETQILGGLLGLCVGDALGVPYEFQSRDQVQHVSKMIGYGTHNKPAGTWSDDSSLTFCLVESLLGGYRKESLQQLFADWMYFGYWTHDDKLPFDIGNTTFKAVSKIRAGIQKEESGEVTVNSNANGSLMRIFPLIHYLSNVSEHEKFQIIEEVSAITHAHKRSKIGCSIYVEFGIQLIQEETPQKAYIKMKERINEYYQNEHEELMHYHRILHGDIANLVNDEIKSSGYIVDSLEASLWSFLTTSTYEEAVWKAIRLGEDTDTIGAITGGLAGLYYGERQIPKKWLKKIAKHKQIRSLATDYARFISRKS